MKLDRKREIQKSFEQAAVNSYRYRNTLISIVFFKYKAGSVRIETKPVDGKDLGIGLYLYSTHTKGLILFAGYPIIEWDQLANTFVGRLPHKWGQDEGEFHLKN